MPVVQIGERNIQNLALSKRAGRARKPSLIKRGGRTFSDYARNTLVLDVIPAERRSGRPPIVVGSSHGTGRCEKVLPVSLTCCAVGADQLLAEVHDELDDAVSGPQSIHPDEFEHLFRDDARETAVALGSTIN